MNQTVDRFQLIAYYQMSAPGRCITCGSFSDKDNRKYLDFDFWLEDYGSVYLCNYCLLAAALTIGCISRQQYDDAQSLIIELRAVVGNLISENRGLRESLDDLRNSITSRPDPNPRDYPVVELPEFKEGPSDPDPVEPVKPVAKRKDRSPEPVNVGGSENVSDDVTDFKLFDGI